VNLIVLPNIMKTATIGMLKYLPMLLALVPTWLCAQQFNWRMIGPDNQGGQTRAILSIPGGPVYAGSSSGGLYFSRTRGQSWFEVDGFNKLGPNDDPTTNRKLVITTLAHDASTGTIYVGTGDIWFSYSTIPNPFITNLIPEFNTSSQGYPGFIGQPGQGVFVSKDNGQTFSNVNATWNGAFPGVDYNIETNPFIGVQKVVAKNGRVLVATLRGLYWSDNQLQSVEPAEMASDIVSTDPTFDANVDDLATNIVVDVEFGQDNIVYASTAKWLFISTDGGKTFSRVVGNRDFPRIAGFNATSFDRIEIAVAPSEPSTLYIAEMRKSSDGLLNGVWRSKDNGQSWEQIGPQSSAIDNATKGTFAPEAVAGGIGYGRRHFALAVSPAEPTKIYMGGEDFFRYSDEDGWVSTTNNIQFFPEDPDYVPSGINTIAFDSADPNVVYVGTNSLIVRSDDGGKKFRVASSNYNAKSVFGVTAAINGNIYATTPHTRLLEKPATGAENRNFAQIARASNLSRQVVASSLSPNQILATGPECLIERSTDGTTFERFYGFPDDQGCKCQFKESSTDTSCAKLKASSGVVGPEGTFYYSNSVALIEELPEANGDTVVDTRGKVRGVQHAFTSHEAFIYRVDKPFQTLELGGDPNDRLVWTRLTSDAQTSTTDYVSAIHAVGPDPGGGRPNAVLFFGTSTGRLCRLSDPLACAPSPTQLPDYKFKEITPPAAVGYSRRWITSIITHPTKPETLVFTLGGYSKENADISYVFASFNALDDNPTFFPIHDQSTLPLGPVYCALFNPVEPDSWLALGTDFGVFTAQVSELTNTFTGEVTYTEANDGQMYRVPVYAFAYQPYRAERVLFPDPATPGQTLSYIRRVPDPNRFIYMATGGRGVLRSDIVSTIDDTQVPADFLSGRKPLKLYPNPTRAEATLDLTLGAASPVSLQVLTPDGRVVRSIDYGIQAAGTQQLTVDVSGLAAGLYHVKASYQSNGQPIHRVGKLIVQP
jgi:photosystem II stability/assembly factor-like uncharacterized protein